MTTNLAAAASSVYAWVERVSREKNRPSHPCSSYYVASMISRAAVHGEEAQSDESFNKF